MAQTNFDPIAIRKGYQTRRELEENPTVDFTASSASKLRPTEDFKNPGTRMAGPGGAFATALMQDPQFGDQIAGWRNMYNQSPPGIEFNAAMMQQQQQAMDVQQQQNDMGAA